MKILTSVRSSYIQFVCYFDAVHALIAIQYKRFLRLNRTTKHL